MKRATFLLFSIVIVFLLSCDKNETDTPEDVIVYEEINKTIVLSESDSISGTCYHLVFEYLEENQKGFTPVINTHFNNLLCDGSNSIMADSMSKKVIPLAINEVISSARPWVGVQVLSLDELAGQGEIFLAYRSRFFPEGIYKYRFGWIKIELSSNSDTLTIISRADNQSINKSILSGQME